MAGITIKDAVSLQPAFLSVIFQLGWSRLEVLPYTPDLAPALQAAIADPLWMLGRQWQFSEFKGNDAGSPIDLRIATETARLSRLHLGPLDAQSNQRATDLPADAPPLEALVEPEEPRRGNARLAMQAGAHFLRLLQAEAGPLPADLVDAWRAEYPLTIDAADVAPDDAASRDWAALMNGRAIDGGKLAAALSAGRQADGSVATLPASPALPPELAAAAKRAAQRWLAWYERSAVSGPADSPAWNPHRLEYAVAASAQTGIGAAILHADEYSGQVLDWYSFDVADRCDRLVAGASQDLGSPAAPQPPQATTLPPRLPTPVRFPGMPADRYWEFEDARVNLPALDAGPGDLARMLLLEFAFCYGNDWFFTPLDVPVGSLTRVASFVVRDCFGVETIVRPARQMRAGGERWEMFALDVAAGSPDDLGNLLFVPATVPQSMEGPPLEEVALFRDEMANLAWGVEHSVQGASGLGYARRVSGATTLPRPLAQPPDDVSLVYRLMTPTPEHWFPFVPVPAAGGGDPARFAIRLERRSLVNFGVNEPPREIQPTPPYQPPPEPAHAASAPGPGPLPATIEPRGRLLAPTGVAGIANALQLEEEEVPREGARVRRLYQAARGVDGARLLWLGRRKDIGRGEGSSGLRFDAAERRS